VIVEHQLAEASTTGVSPTEPPRADSAATLGPSQQLEAIDSRIADALAQQKRLRGLVATYRARVEAAPTRATELFALSSEYDELQRQYQELLKDLVDSSVPASDPSPERPERAKEFQVLAPATIPARSYAPNRPLIAASGVMGGLTLGLALVILLEFRDQTFRSPADVLACCEVPVLATLTTIPPANRRPGARARRLLLAGVVVLVALGVFFAVLGSRTSLLTWAWR